MNLSPEDKLILSSIKIELSTTESEQLNNLIPQIRNWDYLIKTIIDRGIGPLFFKKLPLLSNSPKIPEYVKTKLQQAYYKTISRSMVLQENFRKIAEVFSPNNISVIALKGIYISEWLYQDIGLRQFSDIDLLVYEEDGEKCLNLLSGMGYKPSSVLSNLSEFVQEHFDIVHYSPMVLDGVSIEIHIKLHAKTEKYHLLVDEVWKNAIPATINGSQVLALNIYDLLIHLCLHLDKHFRVGKVQFTCFTDITNILNKHVNMIDWEVLTESCRLYNCEKIVFEYILLINKHMNAPVPDVVIQQYCSLFIEEDEQLFFKYLGGYIGFQKTRSAHFSYLQNVESPLGKARYIWDVIFPSKAFMIQKYKIKRPSRVLFYYPYRYFIAIRGMMSPIQNIFKNHN